MLRNLYLSVFARRLLIGLLMLGLAVFAAGANLVLGQENPSPPVKSLPAKPGLLILSHGSPAPSWTRAIMELTKKVEALNADKKVFHAVTGANMEFAKPDAADGIEILEAAGCDRIIVVPVFVCPTSHTHFDVPAVLGLYRSPSIRETLHKENARIAAPNVPVTVTQTMSEGDLLDQFVEDEVRALSKNPKEEAVLLIAHGDEDHALMIDQIMNRLFAHACGSVGISSGQFAYCEVGQSYGRNVIPAIQALAEEKKSVLVVGFYLATSAKSLNDRAMMMGANRTGGNMMGSPHVLPAAESSESSKNPLEGIDVRFSEKGIIDHPSMADWVLTAAQEAL